MGDVFRQMQVELGWAVDTSSRSAAEAAVKASEDRITAENAAALAKRAAAENRARQERIAGELAAGRDLSKADVEFIQAQEKRRRDAAEDAHKREQEGFKKTNMLRDEQFKLASQNFLKLNGVAQAFTTGLSGALGALPFGGMALGIQRTAAGLSDLAVQAQRVGASAAHIQRFVYGMRSAGVDEGQANSTLEGFSSVIKSNEPSYRQALAGLGIKTTGADGRPLDIEQLLEGFGAFLKTQDYTTASHYAQNYGIGVDSLNAFRNGQFTKGVGGYDDRAKAFGFDADKAAEDARKVSLAWLKAETDYNLVKTKLQAEFFVPMMASFDALAEKMEQNPQQVENIGRALEGLGVLVAARTIPPLIALATRLTGISTLVSSTPILLRLLGLGSTAAGVAGAAILAGGAAAGAEKAPMVDDYGRVVGNWGGDPDHPYHQGEEGGPASSSGRPTTTFSTMWDWVKGKLGFGDDQKVKADIASTAENTRKLLDNAIGVGTGISAGGSGSFPQGGGAAGETASSPSGNEGGSRSWRNNNPGNLKYGPFAQRLGATGKDAAGFAIFASYDAGRRAQESLWFDSPAYKDKTLAGAVAQWSPPGENDTAGITKQYAAAAGVDPDTPLSQLTPAQRAKLLDAQQAREGWRAGTPSGPGSVGSGDVVGKALGMVGLREGDAAKALHHIMDAGEWCADFVNGSIEANGGKGSGSAAARSFMHWGKAIGLGDVKRGDVAVLNGGGHVGFFTGERTPDGRMGVVAGNTRDGQGGHEVRHYFVDPRSVFGARRGEAAKVEVVKSNMDEAHQKALAEVGEARRHHENTKLIQRAIRGTLHPFLHGGAITAEAAHRRALYNTYRHSTSSMIRNGDTFNIHAKDAKAGLDAAQRLSAHREVADRTRYGQRSVG